MQKSIIANENWLIQLLLNDEVDSGLKEGIHIYSVDIKVPETKYVGYIPIVKPDKGN